MLVAQPLPHLQLNFAPLLMPSEADVWPPSRAPLRMPSLDEVSEATSCSDTPSLQLMPALLQQPHARCDPKRRKRAGVRALRFLRRNSFSQHAVYCLLSGRPLVVLGADEGAVRKLVEALSLFLPGPGPDGSAVLPCLATPLQLTDLLTCRLIGMHRCVPTPLLLVALLLLLLSLGTVTLEKGLFWFWRLNQEGTNCVFPEMKHSWGLKFDFFYVFFFLKLRLLNHNRIKIRMTETVRTVIFGLI